MKADLVAQFSSIGTSSLQNASIGVDLTYIPEFRSALRDPGTFFFQETFSDWEREKASTKPSDQRPNFFAGRYAAKEAFIKAIDGHRLFQEPDLKFKYSEIEIRNDQFGRPFFRFYGNVSEYMQELKSVSIRVSISHAEDYAFSEVLLVL